MHMERVRISWSHLTQEDADLLSDIRVNPPIVVTDVDDGFTVGTAGWSRPGNSLEARLERLREAGHSDGFVEIVRWAGARRAWNVRFCEDGEVNPEFPIGGYGAGPSPR